MDGEGRAPKALMQSADPGVVAVARDGMTPDLWWGYDAGERVIVRLTGPDGDDRYEVATCGG